MLRERNPRFFVRQPGNFPCPALKKDLQKWGKSDRVVFMEQYKIIEVKEDILANNDAAAEKLRRSLKEQKTFLVNLMSSPGSGKTTTLCRTVEALKDRYRIGIMEADVDSDVDAATISRTGAKVIQLLTGGMCHLDAAMTRQGLSNMGSEGLDLVVLENVGNLICPAEFDTGAAAKVMILSVPEGDDKPLKYPLMFSVCDVLLVNKIDAASYFDFSLERCESYVRKLNPDIRIFPVSAKTGEGMDEWFKWLSSQIDQWKS